MVQKKTAQKTVRKTAQKTVHETPLDKAQRLDRSVVLGVSSVVRGAGKWLWSHKKPILVSASWLVLGTMIGAVRVIPPPANFVKLGLFRIGTS